MEKNSKIQKKLSKFKSLKSTDLLLCSLSLLEINPKEICIKHKLSFENFKFPRFHHFYFRGKPHPAFFEILFKLLIILTDGKCEEEFLTCYPPRNLNDNIEFKKIVYHILKRLEEYDRIPQNFSTQKSWIDNCDSIKPILYLRILAFCALLHKGNKEKKCLKFWKNSNYTRLHGANDLLKINLTSSEKAILSVSNDEIMKLSKQYYREMKKLIHESDQMLADSSQNFKLIDKISQNMENLSISLQKEEEKLDLAIKNEETQKKNLFNSIRKLERTREIDEFNYFISEIEEIYPLSSALSEAYSNISSFSSPDLFKPIVISRPINEKSKIFNANSVLNSKVAGLEKELNIIEKSALKLVNFSEKIRK